MPAVSPPGLENRVGVLSFINRRGVASGNVAEVPSNATLQENQARQRESLVFWSDVQASVTITTTAGDLSLPDVVVSGIPSGAVITRVIALFKFRQIEDSSGSANELEAGCTPAIQVRDDSPGCWEDAINLVDATLVVAANAIAPGDVLIGDNDVSGTVVGDDTYNFQIDQADAVGSNLLLRDVQTGLKVEYAVV